MYSTYNTLSTLPVNTFFGVLFFLLMLPHYTDIEVYILSWYKVFMPHYVDKLNVFQCILRHTAVR